LPKTIDLTDFSASECSDIYRFDVGTMLRVFGLTFAEQKNSSNVKGFL